jgi:hypothetical protein
LVGQLQTIPDPRRQCRNLKHRLVDVLLLGFCGVLADCDEFLEIADWARHHEAFLRKGTAFAPPIRAQTAGAVPSPDTNASNGPCCLPTIPLPLSPPAAVAGAIAGLWHVTIIRAPD